MSVYESAQEKRASETGTSETLRSAVKKQPPREDLLTKGAGDVRSGLQRSPVLFHGRLRNHVWEKRKKGKDMLGPTRQR